jgi:hypothetical protein
MSEINDPEIPLTEEQRRINDATGVTRSPKQDANRDGYVLEQDTAAKDSDENPIILPAGTRVRRL